MVGVGLVLSGLCLVMMSISKQMVVGLSRPPAMYVLGDSLLDVGNNNYLPGSNVFKANRLYYGIDYPSRTPTGRFSNGYNTADYVAKSMGFAASPPAYLSLPPSLVAVTALSSGVSYASGGAGILNSTTAGGTIPLSTQVQYFNATRAPMIATQGSSAAVNTLIGRSVFFICVGSNDMFAFSAQNSNSDQQNSTAAATAFYTSVISFYSAAITDLYSMGARKMAILNVGLVGCVPRLRLLSPTGACSDDLNQLAVGFNDALKSMLTDLSGNKLPELVYSLADSHGLATDTFADPQASGYTDVATACCGGGRLNAEEECTSTSVLCSNRDQLVFFDQFHPSQRAAYLSAKAFYDDPEHQYTSPINFMELAQHTST